MTVDLRARNQILNANWQKAINMTVIWSAIIDKPPVIAAGNTQADARQAIGAGTSNLTLGTTASTASAGNHNHNIAAHTASGLAAATTLQLAFQALSTRIKALEDA